MNKLPLIIWGYVSEIVLTTLFMGVLFLFYDLAIISSFIQSVAIDFASYFSGIMLAGSIAFFWTFYSKSDTPFSQWLYDKGAYNVYLTAYVSAIAIYVSLTVLLALTSKINNDFLSLVTLWFLILGVINVYTFTRNITKQLKLNMEFNRKTRNDREKH